MDEPPVWARRSERGWLLRLRVQPGARRDAVVGPHGDALKVRVAAPAVDGKANAALVRLLAHRLGVRPAAIELVHGAHGRDKVVRVPSDVDLDGLA